MTGRAGAGWRSWTSRRWSPSTCSPAHGNPDGIHWGWAGHRRVGEALGGGAGEAGPVTLLGIDLGTTAVKAAVFRPDGTRVAGASRPHATHRPEPGFAEQDASDWWDGLTSVGRGALRRAHSPT